MTKLIDEPIKVHLGKDSIPDAFIWRKRVYRVTEVLSWWREPAEWWKGKSVRLCFRVDAKNTSIGTIEISRLGESWFLDRVYD